MHVLTTFPRLLDFVLIAPFLLRVSVGILRFFAGKIRHKKEYRWLSPLYIISSTFIIIGLYTQISSIVAIILIIFDYYTEKKISPLSKEQKALTILTIIVLISLIFTGPGFLAFDLPL